MMRPAYMEKNTQRLKKCAAFSFFISGQDALQKLRTRRPAQAKSSILFFSGFPIALQAHSNSAGQAAWPIFIGCVAFVRMHPAASSSASFESFPRLFEKNSVSLRRI
jgi:hypothetical protein